MSYLTKKTFRRERPVLYNNCNTNNLQGSYIKPSNISKVGDYKRVVEGTWLGYSDRLVPAAIVISPYTAGDPSVVVNNPWAFLPGDVLSLIGDETENYMTEKDAVSSGTAPEFGTVDSVDPGVSPQQTTVTPSAVAIGDIYTLKIGETEVSFEATTAVVDDVVTGLYDALTIYLQQSHHSTVESLKIENNVTDLILTAESPGEIFVTTGSVVGAGALDIAIAPGVGTVNITPGAGNAAVNIGAKLRDITVRPLGIIATPIYLTSDHGLDRIGDYAAYDSANINKAALTYLDGDLVASMPTLKYMKPYGIS